MDVSHVGVNLTGRSSFWENSPVFFSVVKNKNFTVAPMGTSLVMLILRNSSMEIGKIVGDICRTGGSNTHIGFGGPSQIFTGSKKADFWQKFRQDSWWLYSGRNIGNKKH